MEEYVIEFLRTAQKELTKLPVEIQQRIISRIEELKINPYPPDVKLLKNSDGFLRFRVLDYRY